MQSFINLLGNSSFNWIPILVFCLLLVVGGLIGFMNGWKSSLYFTVWNLGGLVISVFVFDLTSDKILGLLGSGDAKDYVQSMFAWLAPILVFVGIIVIDILGFGLYFIGRRWLKRSMRVRAKMGASNLPSRILGSAIGVINIVPFTVMGTNITTIFTAPKDGYSKGFASFNDTLVKYLSFTKFEGLGEQSSAIKGALDLFLGSSSSDATKVVGEYVKLLQGGAADFTTVSLTDEIKSSLSTVLNSKLGITIITKQIVTQLKNNTAQIVGTEVDKATALITADTKLELNKDTLLSLTQALIDGGSLNPTDSNLGIAWSKFMQALTSDSNVDMADLDAAITAKFQ